MRDDRVLTLLFHVLPVVLPLWTAPAEAGSLQYKKLHFTGQQSSAAASINGKGQVVGTFTDSTGTHGFVWDKGVVTQVDGPGASFTELVAINAKGIAAGDYSGTAPVGEVAFTYDTATGQQTVLNTDSGEGTYAAGINAGGTVVGLAERGGDCEFCGFVAKGSKFRLLHAPGSPNGTFAVGIDQHGVVVGDYRARNGDSHGFLFSAGSFTSFDPPGSGATVPDFITDEGVAGGEFYTGGNEPPYTVGFTMAGGTVTNFEYPGGYYNNVVGIGPAGEVAGTWIDSVANHGFIALGGTYYDIDVPGSTNTVLTGVNQNGWLVGYFTTGTGRHPKRFAFIARCPNGQSPCTQ
jgi:probable HAF family extracellular repeat protein